MNAAANANTLYTDRYGEIEPNLPGGDLSWLRAMRSEALKTFSELGFPSPREEEWRYTNVSAIEKKLFSPAGAFEDSSVGTGEVDAFRLEDAWTVALVDGRFCAALSVLEELPQGVLVSSLGEALKRHPEIVKTYLGRAVKDEDHGFIPFNTAWFSDGLFVYLPKGTALSRPIHLLHLSTRADALSTTRHIVAAESQSQASIVETFAGSDDLGYLTASVAEIFVGANARIDYYKLQAESEKAYHFGGAYVRQERDGRFHHDSFSFGGLIARNEIHVDLGHAAECDLNGLYLGVKRQHVDNHTRIHHREPHGVSRETYKGILDQRARGVFQGRVVVHEGAQKTDSEMNNRNLLLSDDAEADTKPQLEIYADDVKCAHGVTVGQLDEKSVFYLKARCIDETDARNMLTFAFANEMVSRVRLNSLREQILTQLLVRFPQTGIDREWL
ncbi:MAG: Fe-S cluster assembly protein SufD [Gammaproteobacteria bacterium]